LGLDDDGGMRMGCNCGNKADKTLYTVLTKGGTTYTGLSASAARLLVAKNPGSTKVPEVKR